MVGHALIGHARAAMRRSSDSRKKFPWHKRASGPLSVFKASQAHLLITYSALACIDDWINDQQRQKWRIVKVDCGDD